MSERVEALDRRHDRKAFSCGRVELDRWFHHNARQAQERHGSARVFVLVDPDIGEGRTVLGFYALTGHAVVFEEAGDYFAGGQAPNLPIGAVLLGQLAVSLNWRGRNYGDRLLKDAMRRALARDDDVATPLFLVDALDAEAARYYLDRGFRGLPERPLRLALRMVDIRATLDLA